MNRLVSGVELEGTKIPDANRGKKVCLVTGELEGPNQNGGVGTTNRALAITLRELGYDVDILYTQIDDGKPRSVRGQFSDHVAAFAAHGVRLLCIDNRPASHDWQVRSFLALQHLLRHPYDIVFFDDLFGTAYYPLLARKTGNEFLQDTVMCVTTHGSMEWVSDVNRQAVMNFDTLPLMEMERRSVELADVVKAPSAYILKKYRAYGWKVAPNFIVLPNFVSRKLAQVGKPQWRPINEIVFFGRLERRKGLRMFCRALDRLKFELKDYTVTFLGRSLPEVTPKLIRKSAAWPFPIRLLTDFDQAQALSYLKAGNRLAVMPSTEDNSPSVILECLEENIPFLASSGSGAEELLADESRSRNMFAPTADALCEKLQEVIESGAQTARPSFHPKEIQGTFTRWLEGALASAKMPPVAANKPILSSKPILIVAVPSEDSFDKAIDNLQRTVAAFRHNIRIEIVTQNPKAFAKRLAAVEASLPVAVHDVRDLAKLANTIARDAPAVLGLCQSDQMLTPDWFHRARSCFQNSPGISALTGMAGETTEQNELAEQPYVSTLERRYVIQRHLMGNAPPLFALDQSTNSGFLLLRSELFGLLGEVPLADAQYDRMIAMDHVVHAMLIRLHRSGHGFELVPDLLHTQLQENLFGTHQSVNFLRSLASDLYGHVPGTDQWLLSRLAIDTGLKHRHSLAGEDYRRYLSTKTGIKISRVNESTSWDQQSRELAMVAQASGQIELAVDLVGRLVFPQVKSQTSTAMERLKNSASTVSLADLFDTPQCTRINLQHDWSLKWEKETKTVRLHANRAQEGRATLVFTSLDLGKVSLFTCDLITSPRTSTVRVRLDLVSMDHTQGYSADKLLNARENLPWEVVVPEKLHPKCKMALSVEMADPSDDPEHAYVRIVAPRFVRAAVDELS